jgi:alpha-tubulin suppressor-like RCC1 family protein
MPSMRFVFNLAAVTVVCAAGAAFASSPPLPSLQFTRENTNLVLRFGGRLQQAAQVKGPYTNVIGARSPHAVSVARSELGYWRAYREDLQRFNQRLSAGQLHIVAIRADGSLWSWGGNFDGQLGIGSTVDRTNAPQRVVGDAHWMAVSAGFVHTLALREDGTLWTWGSADGGRLGTGTTLDAFSPQAVAGNATWKAVAGGGDFSVALRNDGTLWTWGWNNYGQLGNGSNSMEAVPRMIDTNTTWRTITAGYNYAMALREDGTLWTWGNNSRGQLGIGTTTGTNRPVQVGTNADWIAVAAPGGTLISSHSLGLRSDGTLWSWGDNAFGQLGTGTNKNSNVPQQVGTNNTWRAMASGNDHSAAIQDDGTLWGWGSNLFGKVGEVVAPYFGVHIPTQIATNRLWNAVAGGQDCTVALRSDGTLWTWGSSGFGVLGDGGAVLSSTPTPQPVLGGATWGSP